MSNKRPALRFPASLAVYCESAPTNPVGGTVTARPKGQCRAVPSAVGVPGGTPDLDRMSVDQSSGPIRVAASALKRAVSTVLPMDTAPTSVVVALGVKQGSLRPIPGLPVRSPRPARLL